MGVAGLVEVGMHGHVGRANMSGLNNDIFPRCVLVSSSLAAGGLSPGSQAPARHFSARCVVHAEC